MSGQTISTERRKNSGNNNYHSDSEWIRILIRKDTLILSKK